MLLASPPCQNSTTCRMLHMTRTQQATATRLSPLTPWAQGSSTRCVFFNFWYYLTLLGRLNSTKDGGTHLRWLLGQLGWDGVPLARRFWVALVVRSRTFPPARVLLELTTQHALLCHFCRNAKDRRNTLVIYSVKYELHLMYRTRILLTLLWINIFSFYPINPHFLLSNPFFLCI